MKSLLFKPWKIKAIAESSTDREWQTRRTMKPQPKDCTIKVESSLDPNSWISRWPVDMTALYPDSKPTTMIGAIHIPRYHAGEVVYLKEGHYAYGRWEISGFTKSAKPKWEFFQCHDFGVWFDDNKPASIIVEKEVYRGLGWYKRSPLFHAERYARTFVQITQVEPCRTKDISFEDCLAEGIRITHLPLCGPGGATVYHWEDYPTPNIYDTAQGAYFALYNSINGAGTHKDNWDFDYHFHQIERPEDTH